MGLSPLLVKEVLAIIKEINRDLEVTTILLVEQNARGSTWRFSAHITPRLGAILQKRRSTKLLACSLSPHFRG
jgi:ABC-type branched-subunit amino acid transport system ATPase component